MFCIIFNLLFGFFLGWLAFEQPHVIKEFKQSVFEYIANLRSKK